MSHDLYFYKKTENFLSTNDIRGYLNQQLLEINNEDSQWFYENVDTGVYFAIDFNEAEEEDVEFTGMVNTHFSFNLNFIRPDFFGAEAFTFIEKFITDLDLYVIDPQAPSADTPKKFNFSELYDSWINSNHSFSKRMFDELELSYISPEKSNFAWNYNYKKAVLQEKTEEYFVPRIIFAIKKNTREVITLCTWTQCIPTIIPPVDYILIQKYRRKFIFMKREDGIISYAELMRQMGNYFDESEGLKIIQPETAERARDKFNSITYDCNISGFMEGISFDKFVNVKPD